jgi:hypothetical protein
MTTVVITVVVLLVLALVLVTINVLMRRKGYSIPGRTVVRCSKGHLFKTTWIEGGSLRAVRLGPGKRYQRCPVGQHWAIIRPVREEDLTDQERQLLLET